MLIEAYNHYLLTKFGNDTLNLTLIKPIKIDLLRDLCRIDRYDLQNQVNFGYLDIKFQYLSYTKTISCNLTGMPAATSVKSDDIEVHSQHSRITYTNKLQIMTDNYLQDFSTMRLPKIKNYL